MNEITQRILGSIMFILLVIGFMWGVQTLEIYGNNQIAQENCRLMTNNGHQTKIELMNWWVWTLEDCYIKSKENFVPYDRYRSFEE